MPVDRNWTVPEDLQPLVSWDEEGNLVLTPRVVSDDDPDALTQAVWEAVTILRRVGGTIQIASQRGEIAPQVVITESYIFAYNSFTPLVRRLGADPHAAQSQAMDATGGSLADDLTREELEQHFPEGGMADVIAAAQAEQPAESVDTAAAVE